MKPVHSGVLFIIVGFLGLGLLFATLGAMHYEYRDLVTAFDNNGDGELSGAERTPEFDLALGSKLPVGPYTLFAIAPFVAGWYAIVFGIFYLVRRAVSDPPSLLSSAGSSELISNCPHCKNDIVYNVVLSGSVGKCPRCHNAFTFPTN
jgi:hypothetical protein